MTEQSREQHWGQSAGSSGPSAGSRSSSSEGRNDLIWQNRLDKMHRDAEQNLADGALTAGYRANPQEIVALLQRAMASEWASFLQYWHHYFMASDIHSAEVKAVFKEHAEDEFEHARLIGDRIQQLGGVPVDKPDEIHRLTPTTTEYNHDLRSMMEADLVGERETIDFYDEIIRTCGFDDNVTRSTFDFIVKEEADHADDWATLLYAYDGSTGKQIQSVHDELVDLARNLSRGGTRRTA
jgi:bacterioferritin